MFQKMKLKNTDIVEIVTSKTAPGPKIDWLKNVKTATAKNRIVSFLKKQNKEENIAKGRELLEREIIKLGYDVDGLLAEQYMDKALEKFKFRSLDECFESIGFGVISPKKILNKLIEVYNLKNNIQEEKEVSVPEIDVSKKRSKGSDGVIVEGIDNCLVKFAKCCDPLPGDDIVGYITFGKGVSIHRADCSNLTGININERKINVSWKEKTTTTYQTKVIVKANDRTGVAMDVIKILQDAKIKIIGFTARSTEDKTCIMDVVVEISSVTDLTKIIKLVKKVESVYDVKRAR